MKTLQKEFIKISDNLNLLDKENHITPYVSSLIEKVYYEMPKGKENTLKRLIKYANQFPKVPVFKNYLSSFYAQRGNLEEANKINEIIVEKHPNYLYGKINYASHLIENNKYDEALEVLGNSLLLHELYPERDEFLLDEVITYYSITFNYLYHIEEYDKADARLKVLEEIEPHHHKLKQIKAYKAEFLFKKAALRFQEEKDRIINVKEKDRRSHLQTTKPPKFHFEKQIFNLYSYDLDEISKEVLLEIERLDRKKLVEDLIAVLYDSIYRFDYFSENYQKEADVCFPIHALLILKYLKDDSVLDVILEIYRQDKDYIEFWFGYESSEYLTPVLFHINKTIEETLLSFLKEENISALNKSEVHTAFIERVIYKKTLTKEDAYTKTNEFLDFLINNYKNENILDTELNGFIVTDLLDYGEIKFLPKIKKLFNLGIVEVGICGTYIDVEEEMKKVPINKKNIKEYNSLKEVYDSFFIHPDYSLQNKRGFEEGEYYDTSPKLSLPSKKIGRNEPCPCGSGKKYKKCCLNS